MMTLIRNILNHKNNMALSREQFQQLRDKGLSVEQIIRFEKGESPRVTKATTGDTFAKEEPQGFLGKARDFVTGVIGGGKLAEGAGMALAAPEVQKNLSTAEQLQGEVSLNLVKAINERKVQGGDTSRLEEALAKLQEDQKISRDVSTDFTSSLPTNKEVLGSALRLGTTFAAPLIAGKLSKATALGKSVGFGQGALRGAGVGAGTGAIEGALQGAGLGLEENKDIGGIGQSAAIGGGVGALTGGAIGGLTGGVVGAINKAKDPNTVLDYITPKTTELTPTQYKDELTRGRIIPKTKTSPAQYTIPQGEKEIALKYADIITKDPVKTTTNIMDKISSLDTEVGTFLRKNNGIFSKGELRNALNSSLQGIDDITIPTDRLEKAKTDLVNRFVSALETNDMESLWIARKKFDTAIKSSFSGSPTLQKQVNRALRDSVQEFISERTSDGVYSGYMKDMSKLFDLSETVGIKAAKERGFSGIEQWVKNNPTKWDIIKWGTILSVGSKIFPPTGSGSSGG